MPLDRRQFLAGALATAAPRLNSVFNGVTVGIHTYSFRDRPLDRAMDALVELGVGECDLGGIHIEPARGGKDYAAKLSAFRMSAPISDFEAIGRKFRAVGIRVANYTYNFSGGTDAELDRGFEMARALGASSIAMSTRVSLAKQVDAAARRAKMRAGLHNHSRIQPDQFGTPDDFAVALRGASDYLSITLDVGHFVAAGFDPVPFLREHHARILSLHLKDRKKNQGATLPFGEGDVPLHALLRLIRDNRYRIPGYIEHEYASDNPVEDVRKALAYCQRALKEA